MTLLIKRMLALFSTRDAAAFRTAGAGEGPHTPTPPEPQRLLSPHTHEIADAMFLARLEREEEIKRQIQFDTET